MNTTQKIVSKPVKEIQHLLDASDICSILGISRNTFQKMIPDLSVFKVRGVYKCRPEDLETYINNLKIN